MTGHSTQNKPVQISIIIPTLNEEDTISGLLTYLKENSNPQNILEILVVDGGSTDQTLISAKKAGAQILHSEKGRAKQMNKGGQKAQGEILYFLHADTLPPKGFDGHILNSFQKGYQAGCFRMKFKNQDLFLAFFAWFTRFNFLICRGGDQSLYMSTSLFQKLGGFNEKYMVYEDNELIGRIYRTTKFRIIPKNVITSARRYTQIGRWKLQYHFAQIHIRNFLGAGPEALWKYYQKHICG